MFILVPSRYKILRCVCAFPIVCRCAHASPRTITVVESPKEGFVRRVSLEIHFADKPTHVVKELDYLIAFHALRSNRPSRRYAGCIRV